MSAVVFEGAGRCAVFWPPDIASRWRGDDFEPGLRKPIAESGKSRASYSDTHKPTLC